MTLYSTVLLHYMKVVMHLRFIAFTPVEMPCDLLNLLAVSVSFLRCLNRMDLEYYSSSSQVVPNFYLEDLYHVQVASSFPFLICVYNTSAELTLLDYQFFTSALLLTSCRCFALSLHWKKDLH